MHDKSSVPTDMSSVISYVLKTMVHRDPGYKQMERERLDKQRLQYEQLLHSVLNRNEDTIKKCIYIYSDISNKIKTTKTNIKLFKEKLVTCKNVMNLDYENLAYLFHNSAMYDETMTLLDKMEKFMNVSSKIEQCMVQKEYVEGAKLLKTTFDNYDSLLHHVNALSTIRIDLDAKFHKYYEFLIQEMFKVLFELTPSVDLDDTSNKTNQMNISEIENILSDLTTSLIMIKKLPDVILLFQNNIYLALEKIIVDVIDEYSTKQHDRLLSSYKKEACSIRIFSSLLGTILDRFKTVSDHIKCFFTVISTRDMSPLQKDPYIEESEQSESRRSQRAQNNLLLYDLNENMKTVWLQIHYALETLLSCYLPMSTQTDRTHIISKDYIGEDFISQIFSSRYNQNPKYQTTLFHFDSKTISGAVNDINNNPFKSIIQNNTNDTTNFSIFSGNSPMRNDMQLIKNDKSNPTSWLILKQNYHYIGYVYQTLVVFLENGCAYLEDNTGYVGTLNNFIVEYTDDIYIPNVKDEFCEKLNKLMEDPTLLFTLGTMNYWKISVRDSPVTIGVLALFDESLCFIRQLSLIPHYSNTYIEIIVERVEKFLKVYNNFLEKLYNPEIDDIHQIAAAQRLNSKTDSNEVDAKANKTIVVTSFESAWNPTFRFEYQAILDKFNELNKKSVSSTNLAYYESYLYIVKSLSGRKLKEYNMIQKNIHLKTLVTALESLDWLHEVMNAIYKYFKDIKSHKSTMNTNQLPLSVDINANLKDHVASVITKQALESLKTTVKMICQKYETLKLSIHLEVRLRCLYNLSPFFDPQNYFITTADTTIDPIILHVVTDILDFVDICQNYLHVKNSRFVFSGLSVFLSKLFIDAVENFKMINQNGIDKMLHNISALKRDLSGCDYISGSLDIAIVYYEMLNKTPDEIFENIKEHSAQFTLQEYSWIINLIAAMNSLSADASKFLLDQLNTIFNTL